MTGRADEQVLSSWDWVEEEFPNGTRLLFVRDIPPEQIMTALGADPAHAELLTLDVTFETLIQPFARVGRTGEWAFCIDNCAFNVGEFSPTAQELSAGTELALLDTYVPTSGYFWYFADGAEVTSFEPLLSPWRDGSDPDRFVPQMRQVGLDRRTAPRRRPPL